jgi:hypothetical protein
MALFPGSPVDSSTRALAKSATRINVVDRTTLKFARFSYTHEATAGDGEINLVTLPPGAVDVYSKYSKLVTSAMAAGAILLVGHRAYTTEGGVVHTRDHDSLVTGRDATTATDASFNQPGEGVTLYDSQQGVQLFCEVTVANIRTGDTIAGWVAYTHS